MSAPAGRAGAGRPDAAAACRATSDAPWQLAAAAARADVSPWAVSFFLQVPRPRRAPAELLPHACQPGQRCAPPSLPRSVLLCPPLPCLAVRRQGLRGACARGPCSMQPERAQPLCRCATPPTSPSSLHANPCPCRAGAPVGHHQLGGPGQLHRPALLLHRTARGARRHLRRAPHQGGEGRRPVGCTGPASLAGVAARRCLRQAGRGALPGVPRHLPHPSTPHRASLPTVAGLAWRRSAPSTAAAPSPNIS